jgi:DNA-directed RNA polymerase specialized sigma24 family protein
MPSPQSAQETDDLLEQWFRETDAARARALMEILVGQCAEPLIRRIVRFKLESGRDPRTYHSRQADIEDVCSTALFNLLARLERIKAGEDEPAVRNFTSYAAVTAYNACNEYFRFQKPAWFRLSMKLRYLATHDSKFSLWQSGTGREVCGLARDRGHEANPVAARLSEAGRKLWGSRDPRRLGLGELVQAILDAAGAPLNFEDLVDAAAEWAGDKEARLESLDDDTEDAPRREAASADRSAEARLRERQFIQQLWKEICDLPLEHRKALLFNLQDSAGGDIQLFDFLGIATIGQIAAAVEMEPLEFGELWKRLPLDDVSIAVHLGLSRQDVANRRSSARKRLARKMQEFERKN